MSPFRRLPGVKTGVTEGSTDVVNPRDSNPIEVPPFLFTFLSFQSTLSFSIPYGTSSNTDRVYSASESRPESVYHHVLRVTGLGPPLLQKTSTRHVPTYTRPNSPQSYVIICQLQTIRR